MTGDVDLANVCGEVYPRISAYFIDIFSLSLSDVCCPRQAP